MVINIIKIVKAFEKFFEIIFLLTEIFVKIMFNEKFFFFS